MKVQKIILCVAVALSAFGASLGLLEIGAYIRTASQPIITEFRPIEPPPNLKLAEPRLMSIEESAPKEENELESKEGYYHIFGKIPKGFKDFEYFHLSINDRDEKLKTKSATRSEGWFRTKNYPYNYSSIKISERKVSFVTETYRGVSYRFDGDFIEPEIINDEANGIYNVEIFLKGRLTKLRNGKKIAEATMKMAFFIGC